MTSSYPGSLDSFDTIASDKKTSDSVGGRTHRQMHNDLGDAIEAVQTELGANPSGSDATVAARLSAIEAGTNLATGAVTSAKIADGTIVNADVSASAAIEASKIAGLGNLLTTNQASFETDTTGWVVGANCTLARSTAQAASGSASMSLTATSTFVSARTSTGTSGVAVIAGNVYTATLHLRAATDARDARVDIYWYKSDGSDSTTSVTTGSYTTNTTSGWTLYQLAAIAPSDAAYASVRVLISNTVSTEVHYLDKAALWHGALGQWVAPGVPVPGQSPVLVSPNGSRYLLSVNNSGTLSTAAIA